MSGKAKNKGSLHYDTQTNRVMTTEDEIDEQNKYKVDQVLEVCPRVKKDEIILVLQHFCYDVDSTVNAFMETGAADILKDWRHCKTGTKPVTKPKKKKNKKKKGLVNTMSEETENSSDNSHNIGDDQLSPSQEEAEIGGNQMEAKLNDSIEEVPVGDFALPKETENEAVSESVMGSSTQKSSACSSPQSEATKHRSSGSSRTASFSEDVSRHSTPLSSTSSNPAGQGKKSLERSVKDLSRQSVALQRIHNLLEEELDKSSKRIKSAFAEVQKLLEERNQQLEEEMEKVKKESRLLLSQRQELAVELKRRTERTMTMTDAELNDLRADIKHFVIERKYDDELGKTQRFVWDKDRITQEIKTFGEIAHVKNCFSQRRQSTSSGASSFNVVTPTPSDPLGTEEQQSPAGSVETSTQEEATEQKGYNSRQQGKNRSRTFFASKDYYGTRPDYRPFQSRGGRNWRRGRPGPPRASGSRRDEGYWDRQVRHQVYSPPFSQPVYRSEATTAEGDTGSRSAEPRPPYRHMHYRGRGYVPQHGTYGRNRHPSKDLQMNGEAPKPADSANIANGFVGH